MSRKSHRRRRAQRAANPIPVSPLVMPEVGRRCRIASRTMASAMTLVNLFLVLIIATIPTPSLTWESVRILSCLVLVIGPWGTVIITEGLARFEHAGLNRVGRIKFYGSMAGVIGAVEALCFLAPASWYTWLW